jgi:hypothetical protein
MLGQYISVAQARMHEHERIDNKHERGGSDSDRWRDDIDDVLEEDELEDLGQDGSLPGKCTTLVPAEAAVCFDALVHGESDIEGFLSCLVETSAPCGNADKDLREPFPASQSSKLAAGDTISPFPENCFIFRVWRCIAVYRNGKWGKVCGCEVSPY